MREEIRWAIVEGSANMSGLVLFMVCVAYLVGVCSAALVTVMACVFGILSVLSVAYVYVDYLEMKAEICSKEESR